MKLLSTSLLFLFVAIQSKGVPVETNVVNKVRGDDFVRTTIYSRGTNSVCKIIQIDTGSDGRFERGAQFIKVDGKDVIRFMKWPDGHRTYMTEPSADLQILISENKNDKTIEKITIQSPDFKFIEIFKISPDGFFRPVKESEIEEFKKTIGSFINLEK